jgi:hypothetical protein
MNRLFQRALGAMARNLNPREDGVHFHAGPAGPYPCDHAGCVTRRS